MWFNFFSKKRKLDLDPSRAKATYALYDETRGYAKYTRQCQDAFRGNRHSKPSLLEQQGIEHLTILEEKNADDFLSQLPSVTQKAYSKPEMDYSEFLQIRDQGFLLQWFQKIFSTELTNKIRDYFGSEFLIYWHAFLKAQPADQPTRSFLWHCDKGPSSHLKILLYLNDFQEHQGNTIFLDRATTDKFAKIGYVFGPVKKRIEDLGELAKQNGMTFQAHSWEMQAGQGIIFEPAQVLHRGWLPSTGHRYVLVFCLLPSPMHWQVMFDRTNGEGFSSGYTWHEDAQKLWEEVQGQN